MPCNLYRVRAVVVELDASKLISPESAEILQTALRASFDPTATVVCPWNKTALIVNTKGTRITITVDRMTGTEYDQEVLDYLQSIQPRWKGRMVQEEIRAAVKKARMQVKKEEWLPDGRLRISI